mmetsp:Transcript_19699/g.61138  ORF Transcript_19699/g.61138 Transcript_19699/m.61138 type:complete len:203 (+) Transcript_19699:303-911(+)
MTCAGHNNAAHTRVGRVLRRFTPIATRVVGRAGHEHVAHLVRALAADRKRILLRKFGVMICLPVVGFVVALEIADVRIISVRIRSTNIFMKIFVAGASAHGFAHRRGAGGRHSHAIAGAAGGVAPHRVAELDAHRDGRLLLVAAVVAVVVGRRRRVLAGAINELLPHEVDAVLAARRVLLAGLRQQCFCPLKVRHVMVIPVV